MCIAKLTVCLTYCGGILLFWNVLFLFFFLTVSLYTFDKAKQCIGTMTIEIDFLQKKNIDSNPYDTDKMAAEFIQQFNSQAFSVGQQVWVLFWFFKAKMFLRNMRMLVLRWCTILKNAHILTVLQRTANRQKLFIVWMVSLCKVEPSWLSLRAWAGWFKICLFLI